MRQPLGLLTHAQDLETNKQTKKGQRPKIQTSRAVEKIAYNKYLKHVNKETLYSLP